MAGGRGGARGGCAQLVLVLEGDADGLADAPTSAAVRAAAARPVAAVLGVADMPRRRPATTRRSTAPRSPGGRPRCWPAAPARPRAAREGPDHRGLQPHGARRSPGRCWAAATRWCRSSARPGAAGAAGRRAGARRRARRAGPRARDGRVRRGAAPRREGRRRRRARRVRGDQRRRHAQRRRGGAQPGRRAVRARVVAVEWRTAASLWSVPAPTPPSPTTARRGTRPRRRSPRASRSRPRRRRAASSRCAPHLVWGPGRHPARRPHRRAARARGRLALVGGGRALVDTTYVDNAVAALVAGLDAAAPGAACSGRALRRRELRAAPRSARSSRVSARGRGRGLRAARRAAEGGQGPGLGHRAGLAAARPGRRAAADPLSRRAARHRALVRSAARARGSRVDADGDDRRGGWRRSGAGSRSVPARRRTRRGGGEFLRAADPATGCERCAPYLRTPMSSMSSGDDVPDAAGLTRAPRRARRAPPASRRRGGCATSPSCTGVAASGRCASPCARARPVTGARELDPAAATAEALADMRAGAARSPMLHTLARALERERERDGPSVEEAARRLLGDVPGDVLRELEAAVGARAGARAARGSRGGRARAGPARAHGARRGTSNGFETARRTTPFARSRVLRRTGCGALDSRWPGTAFAAPTDPTLTHDHHHPPRRPERPRHRRARAPRDRLRPVPRPRPVLARRVRDAHPRERRVLEEDVRARARAGVERHDPHVREPRDRRGRGRHRGS